MWLPYYGREVVDASVYARANSETETPEIVASRIRRALPFVSADRIVVAPDCVMKYLPHGIAFGKMMAMVEKARQVRSELGVQR